MAATSSFLAGAVRRCRAGNPSNPIHLVRSIIPSFLVDRPITTEALPSVPSMSEDSSTVEADDLGARIFWLRFPKRSATAALERWVSEGKKVTASELRRIARDLRKAQRYKHALEMEASAEITKQVEKAPAGEGGSSRGYKKIFVAGATGRTGKRIVELLTAKGFEVRAGALDLDKAAAFPRMPMLRL